MERNANETTPEEQAAALDPNLLIEFALARGWFECPVKSKGLRVFQRWDGDEFFQIRVPLDRNFSDFGRAMLLACRTLAEVAGVRFERTECDFRFLNPASGV